MEEITPKKEEENSLLSWYQELPRTKKSKFLLALQFKFSLSSNGVYNKIKCNNWRPFELDIIEDIISDGSWEK